MASAAAQPQPAEGEQDLSMEEILQSIRRIIAEEGEDGDKAPSSEPIEADVPLILTEEVGATGSDVLELTEMVQEDGSTKSINAEPAAPVDVLANIDNALAKEEIPAAATPAPVAEEPVTPSASPSDWEAALLSSTAAEASSAALKKLSTPAAKPSYSPVSSANFRSGNTVEDLAMEALMPMLKDWLDNNLPSIVERIVEREVKRLAGG